MHKFTKISVSFLLMLSILISPFSFFDIRSEAVATAAGFGGFIVEFIIDQIVFQVGNQMWQTSVNDPDGMYSSAKLTAFSKYENFVTAPDIIQVEYDIYPDEFGNPNGSYKPTGFYLDETKILTDEQRETYQLIVDTCNDYLASGGDVDLVCYNIGGAYGFDATTYPKVKEGVTNQLMHEMTEQGIIELGESGVLPVYDFDFVGPQPSLTAGVTYGTTTLNKDGFVFTPPVSSAAFDEEGELSSLKSAESFFSSGGFTDISTGGSEANGFHAVARLKSYGCSQYILYDGVLYYREACSYTADGLELSFSSKHVKTLSKKIFYSADGKCLADVYTGGVYQFGFAINKTGEVKSGCPVTKTVSDNDFISESGGSSITIPRTEAEDIIRKAMELGLTVPDSWIQFADDGSVQSVDGIELSKLQELIDAVNAGNLGFENVQEYLDLITQLIGAGNLSSSEQVALLKNLKELENSEADDISAIREAIEKITAESEAVAENDFDIKTPDTIIDKFPFCLPFDIYTIFNLLSAQPVAPEFEIPFEMEGYFEYTIDVDLSEFETVATIVRWFLYIIFIIGLILVTNKLIGRG